MAHRWMDIFALSQFSPNLIKLPYSGRTVRIIIRNFVSGDKIRITLANRYGTSDVMFERVSVCNCDSEGNMTGDPVVMKFNNEEYGIVAEKSSIISDEINYKISEGFIAVSIFFGKKASVNSVNMLREKVIISEKGDYTLSPEIAPCDRFTEKLLNKAFKVARVSRYDIIPLLECVSVYTENPAGTVLAFGDSITQGGKWSYELANRLNSPVINLGISGNRVLRDCSFPVVKGLMGDAALKRFDRDVLTRQGKKVIIVLLGTNDIGQPGSISAPKRESVTAEEVIDGLKEIGLRAKAAGLHAFICTLTPFKHFRMGYIRDAINNRHIINRWIMNNDIYDGYFDYDMMIKDGEDEEKIAPLYDSGDHLHPSDEGSIKMLDAIDIELIKRLVRDEDSNNQ